MKLASTTGCVLLNVAAAALLGNGGTSVRTSLSTWIALSVCGAAGTGGNDVSIFSDLRFCADNRRLRTETASFEEPGALGVVSEVSTASEVCVSNTDAKVPDEVDTGGGALMGALGFDGCTISATVDSEVPPVVLCEDTELLYVVPEKPLESD